jgi:hypothetical protein
MNKNNNKVKQGVCVCTLLYQSNSIIAYTSEFYLGYKIIKHNKVSIILDAKISSLWMIFIAHRQSGKQ